MARHILSLGARSAIAPEILTTGLRAASRTARAKAIVYANLMGLNVAAPARDPKIDPSDDPLWACAGCGSSGKLRRIHTAGV